MLPMPGRGESCSGTSILCSQLPWQADTRSECQWQGAVTARECVDAQSPELARPSLPVGSPAPLLNSRQDKNLLSPTESLNAIMSRALAGTALLLSPCDAMPCHSLWLAMADG